MRAIALADFGSTFTKVTLVEAETGRLVARAQAPTTADTDVLDGYRAALGEACGSVPQRLEIARRLHASSAGGGLRMVAVGLVRELTAAAAAQAALNAGARVERVLAGTLGDDDAAEIARVRPEILLFAGGTDGGQEARVVANAEVVADADAEFIAIVACNGAISRKVAAILHQGGRRVRVVANVMPEVGSMNVEPARVAITGEFVERVIRGKGLSASREFDQAVAMPTPEAVLLATQVLSADSGGASGGRGAVVVDVGGATTDIHSHTPTVVGGEAVAGERLLPPPALIRSVQGDLGVRWNAPHVYHADGAALDASLGRASLAPADVLQACRRRAEQPSALAANATDRAIDRALAASCIAIGLQRHCGTLRVSHAGRGPAVERVDGGPDLRDVGLLVGSGGVLVHDEAAASTIHTALARKSDRSLSPTAPNVLIDRQYLLPAAGLLTTVSRAHATALLAEALHG